MSKQLYEEALADAKKLREVAEDNAKKSLIEAVTPRIRDLIERELLGDPLVGLGTDSELGFYEEDELPAKGAPGSVSPPGKLMTDVMGVPSPVSSPDAEGKVTLDLDALAQNIGCTPATDVFMVPAIDGEDDLSVKWPTESSYAASLNRVGESIKRFTRASKFLRESSGYVNEIHRLIGELDNMYAYSQGFVKNPGRKKLYENKLEFFFKKLKSLQEQTMRNTRRNGRRLNEWDIILDIPGVGKTTVGGLPEPGDEEWDPESVTTTIDGEEDTDELDMDDMDDAGDDELDFDDDAGEDGDEDGEEDEEGDDEDLFKPSTQQESRRRKLDNLVVEIDEGMLRREVGRMRQARQLREARALRAKRLVEARRRRSLMESRRRRLYEFDAPSADGHGPLIDNDFGGDPEDELEPLSITLDENTVIEIVEDTTDEAYEGANTQVEGYRRGSRHLTSRHGANRNGSPARRSELAETKLRTQLAETNLFNAKLIFSNKLLQNESLSKRQKAEIIERLDEAKTLREAKLIYESLTKAMAGTSRPLREGVDRRVLGSSSAPTRPASTQLNEGVETERWARLAGITK
jgi:hypothetical protein